MTHRRTPVAFSFSVTLALVAVAGCIGVGGRPHPEHDGGPNGGGPDMTGPPPCVGLACYQKFCSDGSTTSVSGKVTAPNGVDPVYDALVYVPQSIVEFTP